jgi:DNA-binding NarL/FixJ family response regulator
MRRTEAVAKVKALLRCLIVDDNPSYLEAATALLEREGMSVVGTASTADEADRLARELRPAAVVIVVAPATSL